MRRVGGNIQVPLGFISTTENVRMVVMGLWVALEVWRTRTVIPQWLHILSIASVALAIACSVIIAIDVVRDRQHMAIMNVVWPLTALFASVIAVPAYFSFGKLAARSRAKPAIDRGEELPSKRKTPFWMMVAKGAGHCGSGCTLGDIIAEGSAALVPAIAVWFGWKVLFSDKIFAIWIFDFMWAFALGIVFQYFTIKPMRDLSISQGIWQAVKADTLSLSAWQVGMYGFMAVAHFYILATLLHVTLEATSVEFWFMMQIAMLFGFATAYPVNWWLIKKGVKEKM